MTLLAGSVVIWRVLHSGTAGSFWPTPAAATPGMHPFGCHWGASLIGSPAMPQLLVEGQLYALRPPVDLLGYHGMTSDELKTATAEHAAWVGGAPAATACAGGALPTGAVPAGVAVLCQRLLQASYVRLLNNPDWIRRREFSDSRELTPYPAVVGGSGPPGEPADERSRHIHLDARVETTQRASTLNGASET